MRSLVVAVLLFALLGVASAGKSRTRTGTTCCQGPSRVLLETRDAPLNPSDFEVVLQPSMPLTLTVQLTDKTCLTGQPFSDDTSIIQSIKAANGVITINLLTDVCIEQNDQIVRVPGCGSILIEIGSCAAMDNTCAQQVIADEAACFDQCDVDFPELTTEHWACIADCGAIRDAAMPCCFEDCAQPEPEPESTCPESRVILSIADFPVNPSDFEVVLRPFESLTLTVEVDGSCGTGRPFVELDEFGIVQSISTVVADPVFQIVLMTEFEITAPLVIVIRFPGCDILQIEISVCVDMLNPCVVTAIENEIACIDQCMADIPDFTEEHWICLDVCAQIRNAAVDCCFNDCQPPPQPEPEPVDCPSGSRILVSIRDFPLNPSDVEIVLGVNQPLDVVFRIEDCECLLSRPFIEADPLGLIQGIFYDLLGQGKIDVIVSLLTLAPIETETEVVISFPGCGTFVIEIDVCITFEDQCVQTVIANEVACLDQCNVDFPELTQDHWDCNAVCAAIRDREAICCFEDCPTPEPEPESTCPASAVLVAIADTPVNPSDVEIVLRPFEMLTLEIAIVDNSCLTGAPVVVSDPLGLVVSIDMDPAKKTTTTVFVRLLAQAEIETETELIIRFPGCSDLLIEIDVCITMQLPCVQAVIAKLNTCLDQCMTKFPNFDTAHFTCNSKCGAQRNLDAAACFDQSTTNSKLNIVKRQQRTFRGRREL